MAETKFPKELKQKLSIRRVAGDKKRRLKKKIDTDKILEECSKRIVGKTEKEYWIPFLRELIEKDVIPISLLKSIPIRPMDAGKTRFDQIYDGIMAVIFPSYTDLTLKKLLGEKEFESSPPEMKIWKVVLPAKFGISHALIRANSIQDAFALGCDYACRMSLRTHKVIPRDLTVRIQYMSDSVLRRMLYLRRANRDRKRRQLRFKGREFTAKEVSGARLAALGHPKDPSRSIAKYIENKELGSILKHKKLSRVMAIETEVLELPSLTRNNPDEEP